MFDRRLDNERIKSVINKHEFVSPQKGIEICMMEFLKNTNGVYMDYITAAKWDKIARAWTKLSSFPDNKKRIKYLIYRCIPEKRIKMLKHPLKKE